MQNKKYFLGLILFVLFFFIKIDSVFADRYCYFATDSKCEKVDSSGKCADGGTLCDDGVSCDGSTGCATSTTSDYKCCVNTGESSKCNDSTTSGYKTKTECTKKNGTPKSDACSSISTCSQYSGGGGSSSSTTTSVSFTNPDSFSDINGFLTALLTALKGFIVTLAIIFIVIGGILYMLSGGNPGMVKRAKDCWLFSVIGFAIVIAAPTFLKQVQLIMGSNLSGTESALSIGQIATNVLNFLLSMLGIIATISLVIAGGMYMTSYGDEKQTTAGKNMAKWAIIGISIALISLIAIQQISKIITGK